MAHDASNNNPTKEIVHALLGIVLLLVIIAGIAISAWLRPAGNHEPATVPATEQGKLLEEKIKAIEAPKPAEAPKADAAATDTAATDAEAPKTEAPKTETDVASADTAKADSAEAKADAPKAEDTAKPADAAAADAKTEAPKAEEAPKAQ